MALRSPFDRVAARPFSRSLALPLVLSLVVSAWVPLACSDGPHGWEGGGEPGADGSAPNDAGHGPGTDGAPSLDAATAPINGCTAADFDAEDHTADADPRLVLVPTSPAPAPFTPRCLKVKVGQTITWRGNLAAHPMEWDVTGLGGNGTAKFSLKAADGSTDENTVTVLNDGAMTFRCAEHPDAMTGAVLVVRY